MPQSQTLAQYRAPPVSPLMHRNDDTCKVCMLIQPADTCNASCSSNMAQQTHAECGVLQPAQRAGCGRLLLPIIDNHS